MRDFQRPGRSPVFASSGMAATSHPLSTEVAVRTLQAGGNALDAAIAACAMQCVVEPGSTGIGGDCFALLAMAGGDRVHAYNGSGRAPAATSADDLRAQGVESIPVHSPHAVTIPGAVEAWSRLHHDHGRIGLDRILQPAIDVARNGYPIAPRTRFDWLEQRDLLAREDDTRTLFLPGGEPPAVGDIHHQPQLAATLERIATEGADAFYTGAVAEDMVSCLRTRGGVHTLADFAAARGEYVEPIATDFRGYRVWECPPNGQGVIALLLLNIFRELPTTDGPLGLNRVHAEIEAAKLACAQRDALVADPALADVPVRDLLSRERAQALAAAIDPKRAGPRHPPVLTRVNQDTVTISVVDREGNAVSLINSLFNPFGSGLLAPRSGVLLQSRGQAFTLEPGHPNEIAPGKRPMHTIIPGMITQGGRVCMPFGVMDGHYQPLGHAQLLARMFDFGEDIQSAMDLARFSPEPDANGIDIENQVPAAVIAGLQQRGHPLNLGARPIGGAQAIWIDHDRGVLIGGSDARKDGCAIGY